MNIYMYIQRQRQSIRQTRSHYVAQAALELTTPMSHPPKCWNYRHILLYLLEVQILIPSLPFCIKETIYVYRH
jgi:hypothetical protein